MVVDDLYPYSARVASNDGLTLPHRFGDSKAEAFTYRFLQHYIRGPLKGIDHSMCVGGKEQDVDITIVVRGIYYLVYYHFRFWIVRRLAASQHELKCGYELLCQPV